MLENFFRSADQAGKIGVNCVVEGIAGHGKAFVAESPLLHGKVPRFGGVIGDQDFWDTQSRQTGLVQLIKLVFGKQIGGERVDPHGSGMGTGV